MAQALTAANPWVVAWPGNSAPSLKYGRAADSQTWKRGQLGYWSSGTIAAVAGTGITDAPIILESDQSSSTSSTDVWYREIQDGTELMMFVMTNGVASAAATANKMVGYGVEALSNVTYLDIGTTSGKFYIVSLGSDLFQYGWPRGNTAANTIEAPALVRVRYIA